MSIVVAVQGRNGKGNHVFVAKDGARELHRDSFDVDSAFMREKFIRVLEAKAGANDGAFNDLEEQLVRAAAKHNERENGKASERAAKGLERLTSAQLNRGTYETKYLVEDVVPQAQGGILSGRFKTLKTTVGIDLAISAATGEKFLGRFNVPDAVPTGIISAESGHGTLQESARRIAKGKGLKLDDVTKLVWSTSLPSLPVDLDLLEAFVKADGLQLLLLDPSYLMFSGVGESASNVFRMGGILQMVTMLIRETNCAIVLLNHNRKSRASNVGQFDPPDLSEISMSGFAERARFWLLLGPQREWDDTEGRHWLWLRTGGSAGHTGLFAIDATEGKRKDDGGRRWEVKVATATEAKREREQRKAREVERTEEKHVEQLIEALRSRPGGETRRQLKTLARLNDANFDRAESALWKRGAIEEFEIKKRGGTFAVLRLTGAAVAESEVASPASPASHDPFED